jgi:PIN domain nuclease of toxin-antitoxin system
MPRPLADLNLVLATIKEEDALKRRAEQYVAKNPAVMTLATGIELLLWCRKHRLHYVDYLDRAVALFDAEGVEVLLTAAQALQDGIVTSPFDAVHLSEALHRGTVLATADEALWKTRFPTERF